MLFGFGRRPGDTTLRRKKQQKQQVTARQAIPGLRILEKIAAGGFCTVFKAQHVPTGETVALKVLAPRAALDPSLVQRFLLEARLLCSFDHPNLVKGFGCGKAKGLVHLVMEWVKGESAQGLLEQWNGALEPRVALDLIAQVAAALQYLHEQGIVHRDVKPANILVTPTGRAKLCDLGLAYKVDPNVSSGAHAGLTAGTPGYMSPEQARGKIKLDVRSDLYALGASLYHMVTGEAPVHDPLRPDLRRQAVLDGIARKRRHSVGFDRATVHFVLRLMEDDPQQRYPSATDLVRDIRQHQEGILTFPASR